MKTIMRRCAAIVLGLTLGLTAWAGLETVVHIQDLNSSWPLGSDLASTSDDHIRNIKSALKTDFPNFNGTYTSATAPVFAIPSDTNTGMYSVGADDLGFSTGGILRFDISTTAFTGTLPALGPAGSATAPTWSFSGDSNTGAYSVGADDWGITTGGTLRFDISTTAFTGTLPWRGQDGTVSAPAFSFSGDTDTGIYRGAANDLRISTAGTLAVEIGSSQAFAAFGQIQASDGTLGAPGISFLNDTDTGLFRAGANDLRVAAGGALVSQWLATGLYGLFQDGSAAGPALTFFGDTDTGFYRDTANQIGIALGGATAGQIAQGTISGTIATGCTTTPAISIPFQRLGKMLLMTFPSQTCTSGGGSGTAFTISGVPAAHRPSTSTTGRTGTFAMTDNSIVNLDAQVELTTGGVLTFYRATSATGFTGAGSKGFPSGVTVTLFLDN